MRQVILSAPLEERVTRPGSRAHALQALAAGHSLLLEAPSGRVADFMRQVQADIHRLGLAGQMTQAHVLGIDPRTREVVDIVRVTRKSKA